MLKHCTDALKMCFFANRLFSSSGLYPFKVSSQTLETDPPVAPHSAAPGLSIAVSPVWPLEQQGPVLSGESDKPRGTRDNSRSQRESGRLPVKQKDWRDTDPPPSRTAVVNQVNHSTPEFRTSDPNPSCGIQQPCPRTARIRSTALANKWEDTQYHRTYTRRRWGIVIQRKQQKTQIVGHKNSRNSWRADRKSRTNRNTHMPTDR